MDRLTKIWSFLKDKYVYSLTFLLAFVMMIGAWYIGDVGPFGGRSLVLVDGVHQYLPFFSEYQEKLQSLQSLEYSYNVGMGNNFLSLWSYYLSSPFNLIIILCAKSHLPMALTLIVSAKIILGALCFAYYLMHTGKKPEKNMGIVIFSLFYAFSSFVIGYYWNLMWLDCFFVLPIVILGMERMFRKKDSRLYIGALLYCFICNYYISFMICVFLILWFFTFHFRSIKDLFIKGIQFAVASLITAAMSAVVLMPAYKGIMTTASATFGLPKWEYYGSFADTLRSHLICTEVMTNQVSDAGTNLFCGLLTLLFGVTFILMKDVALEKKIKYSMVLVLLVLSFNNQQLNYIWHGFHNQFGIPNRFAFLYIFILIIMAYEVYRKRDSVSLPVIIISYTVTMLFVAYCYFNAEKTYDIKVYIASGAILTVYLVLFVLYKELPKKLVKARKTVLASLLFIAVLEMAVNGLVAFKMTGSSDPEYYYGDSKDFAALKERVEEEDELYRADVLQPILVDEATWHNLKSIGIFGSTVRGEMVTIMGKLGFYTGANEYLYYGATPVTNALFGVKHVYTRQGDFENVDMQLRDREDNVSVYQNDYALPIGYMVNNEVLEFETLQNGPFTVQNELCGALTGIEPIFVSIYDEIYTEVYGTNVEVSLQDDYNANYTNANGSARVDMIFTVPHDMDLYVNCKGSNVNKIALLIDGTEVAYDRYHGQIFHIGEMMAGQKVDIQFNLNNGEDLSGFLYCCPMEFVEEQFTAFHSVLANRSLNVTKYTSNSIEGTIHVEEDGIFMTSLPYDEGWTLYANGEKLNTMAVVEGFLATPLKKGDYTIKMVYHSPGLREGMLLTIFGIGVFVLLIRFEKRWKIQRIRRRKERLRRLEEQRQEEELLMEQSENDEALNGQEDTSSEYEMQEDGLLDNQNNQEL